MVGRLVILAIAVLLDGRIARSMTTAVDPTESDDRRDVETSTDSEIRNILIDLSNRVFRPDDTELILLIARSINDAAKSNSESFKASIEAGARKAQRFVADVTAAYTQAIFRATSAEEAQTTLQRFQDTVQQIVDYAKNDPTDS